MDLSIPSFEDIQKDDTIINPEEEKNKKILQNTKCFQDAYKKYIDFTIKRTEQLFNDKTLLQTLKSGKSFFISPSNMFDEFRGRYEDKELIFKGHELHYGPIVKGKRMKYNFNPVNVERTLGIKNLFREFEESLLKLGYLLRTPTVEEFDRVGIKTREEYLNYHFDELKWEIKSKDNIFKSFIGTYEFDI